MDLVFRLVPTALLIISASALADSPAPGDCPGDVSIGNYQVVAATAVRGVSYADVQSWYTAHPTGGKALPQTTTPAGSSQDLAANTPSTPLEGITTFIEDRAKGELEQVVIDHVLDGLCSSTDTSPYFPKTCNVKTGRENGYADVANTYSALVVALRSDIQNVGACALYHRSKTYIGYRLMSVYDQHQQGTPLEQLLYGLATEPTLGKTEDTTSKVRNENGPGACTYSSGAFTGVCGLVVPLIAYAAAQDVQALVKETIDAKTKATINNKDRMVAYGMALEYWIGKNLSMCPPGQECKLVTDIDGKLTTLVNAADAKTNTSADLDSAYAKLLLFYALTDRINTDLKKLNSNGGSTTSRTDFAQAILDIGQQTMWQFNDSLDVGLIDPTVTSQMANSLQLLTYFEGAYTAFEAKEYVTGVTKLNEALDCLAAKSDANACGLQTGGNNAPPETLPTAVADIEKVAGGAASLAEAKTSSDFATTLDELASPINSWQLRSQQRMLTVQAFGGIRLAGQDRFSIPGYGTVDVSSSGELYAPIGLAWSLNRGVGVFISVIDVGSLVNAPRDVTFSGGTITGQVQSGLSNVLEPGIFYFVEPCPSLPLTFGFGLSWGPSDYRTVDINGGTPVLASRQRSVFAFLSFDIPVFILR